MIVRDIPERMWKCLHQETPCSAHLCGSAWFGLEVHPGPEAPWRLNPSLPQVPGADLGDAAQLGKWVCDEAQWRDEVRMWQLRSTARL